MKNLLINCKTTTYHHTSKHYREVVCALNSHGPVDFQLYLIFHLSLLLSLTKLCFETKMTKVYSKILLMKSSRNNFVFLPAFYLIMWLMKASKNFGKITILKYES